MIGSGLEAVFKEVYELLEEMEDKSGLTRSVGEGTNVETGEGINQTGYDNVYIDNESGYRVGVKDGDSTFWPRKDDGTYGQPSRKTNYLLI